MRIKAFALVLVSMLVLLAWSVFAQQNRSVARQGVSATLEADGAGNPEGALQIEAKSDCSFLREGPEKFLQATTRHRRELSDLTKEVIGQIAAEEKYNPVIRRNFIDNFIFDKIDQAGIPRAGLTTDQQFLRRIMLDLTGRIPSASDVRTFLADTSDNKRDALIDRLVGSPEFVDKWTMSFGDLLKNTIAFSNGIIRYADGRTAFYNWIKDSVATNKRFDVMARELITASGSTYVNGNANWVYGATTPMGPAQDTYDTLLVNTASTFLGINTFDCLLCHSGAGRLDRLNLWATGTQRMQAWQMAAFFSRVQSQRVTAGTINNNPYYYWNISDRTTGDYLLNTTSGNRTPRQPTDGKSSISPTYIFTNRTPSAGENYRSALARFVTEDFQFAKAFVNRLWAIFFGIGIVDPVDGFDPARQDPTKTLPAPWTVQPSHPQLLDALAQEFINSGYNIQHMIKLITKSSAYQLSSYYPAEWKEDYVPYFARHYVRRLDAEELLDAVNKATGVTASFTWNQTQAGNPTTVQWAMQLPDTNEPRGGTGGNAGVATFLNTFGRGDRDLVPRTREGSILQGLSLMNDNVIVLPKTRASNAGLNPRVRQWVNSGMSNEQLVEELFLSTLARYPTTLEKQRALQAMNANRTTGTEDLQWVLLNKIDFLFNY